MNQRTSDHFAEGLARATGGAVIFSLPMMMTMEMWWLGSYMSPAKMAILIVVAIPVLTGLAYYSGFEKRTSFLGALVDAFVAYAVGFVTSAVVLAMLAILDLTMTVDEMIGKVTLQAIPAAFGAVLAASQFGGSRPDIDESQRTDEMGLLESYLRELFMMIVGALFLAFNIAPTEEMIVIAYKMTAWHAIALMVLSILAMHAFVYVVKFHGQESKPEEHSWWRVFLRFTIVGYALALLVSLYCMWTFGRTDGTAWSQIVVTAIVLGFPAALGAAAARLIL